MKRCLLLFALLLPFGCAIPDEIGYREQATASVASEQEGQPQDPRQEAADAPPARPSETPWLSLLRRYQPDPYSLDHVSRAAERNERGRLQCPEVELETYRGEVVRYHKPIRIHVDFRERLRRFEAIVADVAIDVYGRAPSQIIHYGTYNCRTIRHRKYRFSEHAFGNAIDIAGFRFDAAPREARAELGGLGGSFRVNVESHWDATGDLTGKHSVFMKTLVRELRKDFVFRGMIVPPAPGHHNHLHLDMGRWSYLRGDVSLPSDDIL